MHTYFPKRRLSLGLLTPTSFELRLLEVALKGKKAFENLWNKESANYDVSEQIMFLEILQEVKLWENDGNSKLLVERARNQVVRTKDHKSLHNRALLVYRDLLNRSLSRDIIEFSDTQCRARESYEHPAALVRESHHVNSLSQVLTIDEKLDDVQSIKFREPMEESCLRTPQGEPSASSSFELISMFGDGSCSSSIFENPTELTEGATPGTRTSKKLSEMVRSSDKNEGEDSISSQDNKNNPSSQLGLKDMRRSWSALKKNLARRATTEFPIRDKADLKIDFSEKQAPQVLSNFPGEDFKCPIWWTVDKVTYEAKSIADLRRKHYILIEGSFRKRCITRTWRHYYGFFLDPGVVIYFRKGVFKKAADLRNSTLNLPNDKPCRLDIRDVIIASSLSNWLLKFDSAKHRDAWYEMVEKICKGQKDKINDLEQSLGFSKE